MSQECTTHSCTRPASRADQGNNNAERKRNAVLARFRMVRALACDVVRPGVSRGLGIACDVVGPARILLASHSRRAARPASGFSTAV